MSTTIPRSRQLLMRSRITVEGIVQGVGFRPFIYNLAKSHNLNGYVLNNQQGVKIEVEGESADLTMFLQDILTKRPPQSHIVTWEEERLPPIHFTDFEIKESADHEERTALISPDLAVCSDCLNELFNPRDRRYRYPFINCTNCGPRYTIIDDIPYDRPHTSMKNFRMCLDCQREYDDPSNRRFHAQPNACWQCGPRPMLIDSAGQTVDTPDPVAKTAELLSQGFIVAIKGLGGFHLAVDATNDQAVRRLRQWKLREEKPFAVMSPNVQTIQTFATLSKEDEMLLQSPIAPIVLLPKKKASIISRLVAPHNPSIGVMLPYTPLHHLLVNAHFTALVMTSGNLKDEPIAIDNQEALSRLGNCVDFFLVHNRDIYLRSDDSVIRPYTLASKREESIIRRARGYVPHPVFVQEELVPLLAVGGEMKNTVCLTREKTAFLSQYIGEMGYRETHDFFLNTIEHMKTILNIEPQAIACDLHPGYASTHYAHSQYQRPVFEIQHHHAHIVSCLAENNTKENVIGVALDGTGYGTDGKIWGGEFLLTDYASYKRVAHLAYLPLPGGDQAIRNPWRMALSYLATFMDGFEDLDLDVVNKRTVKEKEIVLKLIRSGFNSPLTSSMGRLFDAVSALLGICETSTYEGQAAMELEMAKEGDTEDHYPFLYQQERECQTINPSPLLKSLILDLKEGRSSGYISSKFHNSIVTMVVNTCSALRDQLGLNNVALSGGCFQNIYLLSESINRLKEKGFEVFHHRKVPANDGGIALGQALIANERLKIAKEP
ncbi:MAG: carbamoyltransferase HypF [Syntrophaceae bacterium]|nr:carbamoyltransferase HypF [Syntrophaceae bacterium]